VGQSGVPAAQWLATTSARSNSQVAHRIVWCPPSDGLVPPRTGKQPITRFVAVALFIIRCASDSPVHPWTEGNHSLPNDAPTTPWSLGAIKGTHWWMELNTKHPLNILQRRDFANTQLFHCDRDLSTSLSCNFVVSFCVLFLVLCVCCCCNSSSCVCFYSPLLLCSFEIICVRSERLQIVGIPHNGILLR
jgi:hypothetical protein